MWLLTSVFDLNRARGILLQRITRGRTQIYLRRQQWVIKVYHARSLVEVSKCLELQRQYGIKFLAMGLMGVFKK